jgi:MFS family permease
MQSIALSWLVFRITGSASMLGSVTFIGQIPFLLLSYVGGITADRYQRYHILITVQFLAFLTALILGLLTIYDIITIPSIFILAILSGIISAFDIPARQSFLVELVGKDDLLSAITLNSFIFNIARLLGPATAGFLVPVIGEGWCFIINAVSYVGVLLALLFMRKSANQAKNKKEPNDRSIWSGINLVYSRKPVLGLILLTGITSLIAIPYATLLPVFVVRNLAGESVDLGILTMCVGLGALIGGLTLTKIGKLNHPANWICIANLLFGTSLFILAWMHTFPKSLVLMIFIGFSSMLQFNLTNSVLQLIIPDNLRGRVMAVYSTTLVGFAPLGALIFGFLADQIDISYVFAGGGFICVCSGLVFGLNLNKLRKQAQEIIDELNLNNKDSGEQNDIEILSEKKHYQF